MVRLVRVAGLSRRLGSRGRGRRGVSAAAIRAAGGRGLIPVPTIVALGRGLRRLRRRVRNAALFLVKPRPARGRTLSALGRWRGIGRTAVRNTAIFLLVAGRGVANNQIRSSRHHIERDNRLLTRICWNRRHKSCLWRKRMEGLQRPREGGQKWPFLSEWYLERATM